MRFFNEFIEVRKTGQKLPHWEQPGATYFITWRLDDSIPQELMEKWTRERDEWLLENPEALGRRAGGGISQDFLHGDHAAAGCGIWQLCAA